MREYGFEKLLVWQESRRLTVSIFKLTETFPAKEVYGLSSQIRRAALSVSSNIAEGSTRKSDKEQQHYYRIAYGSLMETLNQLIIATDLGYMSEKLLNHDLRPHIEKISSMLYSLKGRQ